MKSGIKNKTKYFCSFEPFIIQCNNGTKQSNTSLTESKEYCLDVYSRWKNQGLKVFKVVQIKP